jgi:hypothetical protein
MAIPKYVSST